MNQTLGDLILSCCVVYVDDVIVFSPDIDTHLRDLQSVFDKLEKAGLKLKLSKFKFAVQKVKYLGHLLTPDGVLPNPEEVEVIKNYPAPTNVKQVRQFLGLCNYYRRFQKNYSKIAKPLHRLTQQNVPWNWSKECEDAFMTLTNNLITAPMLKYADMNHPLILTTNVSSYAIGYILSQKDENGVERVVEYAGRSLRKAEVSYGITDKEGLAVVEGFKHFHSYLFGNFTTVITDHNALKFFKNNNKLTGRVARWAILLSNYDYDIIYKKGSENTNADAISRLTNLPAPPNDESPEFPLADTLLANPVPADILFKEEFREYPVFNDHLPNTTPTILNLNNVDMPKLQQTCPEVGPIYKHIDDGSLPENDAKLEKSIIAHANEYGMRNGVLFHIHYKRSRHKDREDVAIHQVVIPKSLRSDILSEYHDSIMGGHQGFARTYECIRQKYFGPLCMQILTNIFAHVLNANRQKSTIHKQDQLPSHPCP